MTWLLTGRELLALTKGLISEKKQQGVFSLDLTVADIRTIERGGELDFGGSEFREATMQSLPPVKKSPVDSYGWWHLEDADYELVFNEIIELQAPGLVMIFPHERLLAAGASFSPSVVDALVPEVSVLMRVGPGGLSVKQNARVGKAIILAGPAEGTS